MPASPVSNPQGCHLLPKHRPCPPSDWKVLFSSHHQIVSHSGFQPQLNCSFLWKTFDLTVLAKPCSILPPNSSYGNWAVTSVTSDPVCLSLSPMAPPWHIPSVLSTISLLAPNAIPFMLILKNMLEEGRKEGTNDHPTAFSQAIQGKSLLFPLQVDKYDEKFLFSIFFILLGYWWFQNSSKALFCWAMVRNQREVSHT